MDTQLPLREKLVSSINMPKELEKSTNQPAKQVEGSPPVVENSNLPRMTEAAVQPRRIGGKILRMKEDPFPESKGRGKNRMSPVKIDAEALEITSEREYPEQKEKRHKQENKKKTGSSSLSKQKSEAYLRLHLRVENGKMSIVDAHTVEGPLVMQSEIEGNLAYEATLGSKQIAVGSVADVGVNRSFPNPQGIPGQQGHYFIELPSYQFNIRLPRNDLSPSTLPKVGISLYRVKSTIGKRIEEERPLLAQFKNELREVARLEGIPVKKLSKPIQTEINKLFS